MTPHELIRPDWKWGTAEGSRDLDRLLDRRLSFREKLEWIEEAETLTLRFRASREQAVKKAAQPAAAPARPSLPPEALAIRRELVRGFDPDSVWLFGSYARGDAGPDSDLDFLVVVPHSGKSRYERALEARRLVRGIHFPKDIIVLTREEWERDLTAVCSLASTVRREGRVLDDE